MFVQRQRLLNDSSKEIEDDEDISEGDVLQVNLVSINIIPVLWLYRRCKAIIIDYIISFIVI